MYRRLFACAIGLLLAAATSCAGAAEFAARVERVLDGDSLWVRPLERGRAPLEVRLRDIDAPESCQAWGPEARSALRNALKGKTFAVRTYGRDTHGRTLVRISVDGRDIGAQLVEQGHAWSTRSRWERGPLVDEERQAASSKRGLHAAAGAIHPAQFRRSHGPCFKTPRRAPR